MPSPTTPSVAALLAAERARRVAAEQRLAAVSGSKALSPLRWLHRLTGRGPDLGEVAGFLGTSSSEPGADAIEQAVIDDFHHLYYDRADQTWRDTRWMGTSIQKLPLDVWLYQEYLHDIRPDLVIECGTYMGGSALYLAQMMDIIGHGEIVTIDLVPRPGRPEHPRITYIDSSSTEPAVVEAMAQRAQGKTTMVILDSDHSHAHVYNEMVAYAPIVSVGSLLIVEDTNVHGHPVYAAHQPGPWEAVAQFRAERDDFEVEASSRKFLISFNPEGVLRRLR